jgi:hypothetical protein
LAATSRLSGVAGACADIVLNATAMMIIVRTGGLRAAVITRGIGTFLPRVKSLDGYLFGDA